MIDSEYFSRRRELIDRQIALARKLSKMEDASARKIVGEALYKSGAHFVMTHGVFYAGEWRGTYSQGPPLQCYGTAIVMAATHRLKYVEGYAMAPNGEVYPHAWNASADRYNTLIDCTWLNTGWAYMGVEFSVERADDATWNGDACVLDDPRGDYSFFKTAWQGEDYTIQWPASERLDVLRDPNPEQLRRRGLALLSRMIEDGQSEGL